MKNVLSKTQRILGAIFALPILVFLIWRDVLQYALGAKITKVSGYIAFAMFLVTLMMLKPYFEIRGSKTPKLPWPRQSLVKSYRTMFAAGCIAIVCAVIRVVIHPDLTLRHWPFSYENSDDYAIGLLLFGLLFFWYTFKYWRQSRTLSKT